MAGNGRWGRYPARRRDVELPAAVPPAIVETVIENPEPPVEVEGSIDPIETIEPEAEVEVEAEPDPEPEAEVIPEVIEEVAPTPPPPAPKPTKPTTPPKKGRGSHK